MNTSVVRSQQRNRAITIAYFAAGALASLMIVGLPHLPPAVNIVGLTFIIIFATAPIVVGLALQRPIIFPFAVWAALVPFDNLLVVGGVVKIARPLGAAAAAAAVVVMLLRRRGRLPAGSACVWALLLVFATVSLWWAKDPSYGITWLQQIGGLLLVGAIMSMLRADEVDLRGLFCGVVAGGVGSSLYAIATHVILGYTIHVGVGAQSIDHNHFGAALLLPGLCATSAAISTRRTIWMVICGFAAAICVAGIGVSESRGALIAFAWGAVYLLVRSPHRLRLLPFLAGATALLALIPGVFGRFSDSTAGDAAGRYQIWQIGFAAFKHHWFAGSGFGMFMPAYQAAFLEYSQPAAEAQRIQMPHNILVEFGVELGIVGLAFILFAWWWQFRTLREIRTDEAGWIDVRFAIEASTIALFVSSLSLDLLTFKYTWLTFAVAWIARAAYRSRATASIPPRIPAAQDIQLSRRPSPYPPAGAEARSIRAHS